MNIATKGDIRKLKTELKNDIAHLEYRLIIKLGTVVSIALAAVATAGKFL